MRPHVSVHSRSVRLRVACRRHRGHCRGTIRLIAGSPFEQGNDRAGRARFRVAAQHLRTVELALTPAVRARLRDRWRNGGGGVEARTVIHSAGTTSVQRISLRGQRLTTL